MKTCYDVIVVGTGPAGAMTARECALRGLETLILEKDVLPRYKSCAGGITQNALSLLDFPIPEAIIEGECFTVQLRCGNHIAYLSRPTCQIVFTSRAKLDNYLTLKATEVGATLVDGLRVTSVEVSNTFALVRCKSDIFRARIVIGADGAFSTVAKSVREPFRQDQIRVACDIKLSDNEIVYENRSVAIFDFGGIKHGYGWIFPRRNYVGVGICARANMLSSHQEKINTFLERWGVKSRIVKTHWHVVPIGGYKRRTFAKRILLVGDAAGYVDPLFGEGIRYAIRSAHYAAETASYANDCGNFSEEILKRYEEHCYKAFGKSLKKMLYLSNLYYRYPVMLIKCFAVYEKLYNLRKNAG